MVAPPACTGGGVGLGDDGAPSHAGRVFGMENEGGSAGIGGNWPPDHFGGTSMGRMLYSSFIGGSGVSIGGIT